jgi:hypothetical protein
MPLTNSSKACVDVWPGREWIFEVSMPANVQKFIILSPLSQRGVDNFRVTSLSVRGDRVDCNETGGVSFSRGMIR